MKKSSKIIFSIAIIVLIAIIITIVLLPNSIKKEESDKLISLSYGEGFGDGSTNYKIEIFKNGKTKIIYGNELANNITTKECKIDNEKIEELEKVINENANKVTSKKIDCYDCSGTNITIYEYGKEKYSFKNSWDVSTNENFDNIANKVEEIKSICETK